MPLWIKLMFGAAFVFFAVWAGLTILRGLARPRAEPDAIVTEDVEDADVRYRCGTCGFEIRVTRVPGEDPSPPRHCHEEMDLLE